MKESPRFRGGAFCLQCLQVFPAGEFDEGVVGIVHHFLDFGAIHFREAVGQFEFVA